MGRTLAGEIGKGNWKYVHDDSGNCFVCLEKNPAPGSPCVIPQMPSARSRLSAAARRREAVSIARSAVAHTSQGQLVIEAVYRDGDALDLYVDAREARRVHRGEEWITGLSNHFEEEI